MGMIMLTLSGYEFYKNPEVLKHLETKQRRRASKRDWEAAGGLTEAWRTCYMETVVLCVTAGLSFSAHDRDDWILANLDFDLDKSSFQWSDGNNV